MDPQRYRLAYYGAYPALAGLMGVFVVLDIASPSLQTWAKNVLGISLFVLLSLLYVGPVLPVGLAAVRLWKALPAGDQRPARWVLVRLTPPFVLFHPRGPHQVYVGFVDALNAALASADPDQPPLDGKAFEAFASAWAAAFATPFRWKFSWSDLIETGGPMFDQTAAAIARADAMGWTAKRSSRLR